MRSMYKFLLIVIASVIGFLLIFNLMTPIISKVMPDQFEKADLVLDSLKSKKFQPEIVAFGSSLVQTGIDGYVLRKELKTEKIYNLAVPGYDLKAICGYLPYLPSTVETVILGVRIDDFATTKIIKNKNNKVQDSLFQTYISKKANDAEQFFLSKNFKNRGSLLAGIQISVTAILDNDAPGEESLNIIYPYLYPNNRAVSTYQRDIERRNNEVKDHFTDNKFNTEFLELLKRTNEYLKFKNINLVVYLSPSSPDIEFTSQEKTKNFITEIENKLPKDIDLVNCFYTLKADEFYDSVHPNRIGAEKISKKIAQHILNDRK